MKGIKFCQKRDGTIVSFEKNRITNAINKAFIEAGEGNRIIAQKVTETIVERIMRQFQHGIPTVEEIQDIVEVTLMEYNFNASAKRYILYREERKRTRVGV